MSKLELKILDGEYTIHRLEPTEQIPAKIFQSMLYWIGKTDEELSIVCDSSVNLENTIRETDWSIVKVNSHLEFSLVGVLSDLSTILAGEGISIIALSTYNTDYLMIRKEKLKDASEALKRSGYYFVI